MSAPAIPTVSIHLPARTVAARDVESVRLVHDARGVWLVYAATEPAAARNEPYRTVLTEVRPDGSAAARLFDVGQILPSRCAWDLETGAGGERSLLLDPDQGGLRSLRRVTGDPLEMLRAPERGLVSIDHPDESFSHPRVERGPGAGGCITALVDGDRLTAFVPGARRHRPLGAARDGVIVRAGGDRLLVHTAPIAGPYRADALPPGRLRVTPLDAALALAGPPSEPLGDAAVYALDADADARWLVVAGITGAALQVVVLGAVAPRAPVVALAAASGAGLLSSPSVLLAGGVLHVAAVDGVGTPDARILHATLDPAAFLAVK